MQPATLHFELVPDEVSQPFTASVGLTDVLLLVGLGNHGRIQESTQALCVGLQRSPASCGEAHRGALLIAMTGFLHFDFAAHGIVSPTI